MFILFVIIKTDKNLTYELKIIFYYNAIKKINL